MEEKREGLFTDETDRDNYQKMLRHGEKGTPTDWERWKKKSKKKKWHRWSWFDVTRKTRKQVHGGDRVGGKGSNFDKRRTV